MGRTQEFSNRLTTAYSNSVPPRCTSYSLRITRPLQVVYCMDRALGVASACHRFKILKAECLALLGRYPEAQSVARYLLLALLGKLGLERETLTLGNPQ